MKQKRPIRLWEWKAYGHELLDELVIRGHSRDKLYKWMRRHLPTDQSEHFSEMLYVEEARRAVILLEKRVKKHNENHLPKMKRKKEPSLPNMTLPRDQMLKALAEMKRMRLPWWRRLFGV